MRVLLEIRVLLEGEPYKKFYGSYFFAPRREISIVLCAY